MTNAERERLYLLLEECGEVQQAIGKILRHGYPSCDPTSREDSPPTNRMMLERELGDLQHAVDRLTSTNDLDAAAIQRATHDKAKRIGKWLHFQGSALR